MAIFEWHHIYSVGDAEIDSQHKRLFDIANRYHDAFTTHRNNETLMSIFYELIDYTVTHFSAEEQFMQRNQFPGLLQHKEQHQKLVKLVLNYKTLLERRDPGAEQRAMDFIRLWLNGHILGSDRNYGEHARERRPAMATAMAMA
jgi:hemerythrin